MDPNEHEELIGQYLGTSDAEDWEETQEEEPNLDDTSKKKWHDVHPSDVKFNINEGRKRAFSCAREEILHYHKRLKEKTGKSVPDICDAIEVLFGEESPFFREIAIILGTTHDQEETYKFLATFTFQCIMTKDTNKFYDILEKLQGKGASTNVPLVREEYEDYWKKLAEHGMRRSVVSDSFRSVPGWERLQQVFNALCRELMIEGREGKISLVFDDDKIWLTVSGANGVDKFKLKIVRHTKDNRDGLNAHSLCTTGFMFPVNIQFEIEKDSPLQAYERAMSQVNSSALNEVNLITYTDRGYTDKGRVVKRMKKGGDLAATVQRQPGWGFTYDQYLQSNDTRKLLNTQGCASQFVKFQKIHNKTLTLSAFKNGTNTISLAISTLHSGHSWEGIPFNNDCTYPSQSDCLKEIYINKEAVENPESCKDAILDLMNGRIKFLSREQGTSDWFLLRKMSFSSSIASSAFNSYFPLLYRGEKKTDASSVASVLRGPAWQRYYVPVHDQVQGTVIDISKENEKFLSFMKVLAETPFPESDRWREFLRNMYTEYVEKDDNLEEEVAKQLLRSTELGSQEINQLYNTLFSQKESNPNTINNQKRKKEIIDFLCSSNAARKFMMHPKNNLLVTCSKYGLEAEEKNMQNTLINRLVKYERDSNTPNTLPPDTSRITLLNKTKVNILKQSFQLPFKGAKRAACVIGHRNEPIICENFVDAVGCGALSSLTNVKRVLAAFGTGLVAREDKPYIKDSIDGLLVVELDDDENTQEVWGVEIKSRVATGEINKETDYQGKVYGEWCKHNGEWKYDWTYTESKTYSCFTQDVMHKAIRKMAERCQILHHASIYELDKMVFLVGDRDGYILHGNIITLSATSIRSYNSVLEEMYEETLAWAYDENKDRELNKVKDLAATIPSIGGREEFESVFYLWRHVSQNETLPLPPLKRLIPAIHATWNAHKSGSDTTTALIEDHRFQHPYCNTNSRASSRLLLIAFVVAHRGIQVVGFNQSSHENIQNLRKSASKRSTFHQSLNHIHDYFLHKIQTIRNQDASSQGQSLFATDNLRRSSRLNVEIVKYPAPRTNETPTRNTRTKRNRTPDSSEYWSRVRACRGSGGFPVHLQHIEEERLKTRPMKCWLCSKNTHVMCLYCRRGFCNGRINIKNQEFPEGTYRVPTLKNAEKHWYGVQTCYMKEHFFYVEEAESNES